MAESVETAKGWTFFDRERLRKITILRGTNGIFQFRTVVLDRDTLHTHKIVSFWSKETLEAVVGCLLINKEIFTDGTVKINIPRI